MRRLCALFTRQLVHSTLLPSCWRQRLSESFDKDAVEADDSQDPCHLRRRIDNCELMARLASRAVKRDQGGQSRRINTFDRAEVEADGTALDERLQLFENLLLPPPDELANAADDLSG